MLTEPAKFLFDERDPETLPFSNITELTEQRKLGRDAREELALFDMAFSHLAAVYGYIAPIESKEEEESKLNGEVHTAQEHLQEFMAWKFYTHGYYVAPQLCRDLTCKLNPYQVESFHSDLLSGVAGGSNNIKFLLGDVGVGKSSFINYTITNHSKQWLIENNAILLRIDAFKICPTGDFVYLEFLRMLAGKCHRVFYSRVKTALTTTHSADALIKSYDGEKEYEVAICRFFDQLMKDGFKIILIIDNLDQIYHRFDRQRFVSDIKFEEDTLKDIVDLVLKFTNDQSSFSNLGLSILVSLRRSTYIVMKEAVETIYNIEGLFNGNKNIYCVTPADWDVVFSKRFEMILDVAESYFGSQKKNSINESYKNVIGNLSRPEEPGNHMTLLWHLQNMTILLLRDAIMFFSRYIAIENESWTREEVVERFFYQYHVGILAYILKGRRIFSQTYCDFPNLFLVNSRQTPHPHSYWLKYLIVQYIKRKTDVGASVTADKIDGIFCSEGGYPKSIVSECLGSLCEFHHSSMATYTPDVLPEKLSVIGAHIKLTMRGFYLTDYLYNKFTYLQLVVDDYLLPFPEEFVNDFKYSKGNDYGYLQLPPEGYSQATKQMIRLKAKQVLLFMELLVACYDEYESKLFSPVFERLKMSGIEVDPLQLQEDVREELANFPDAIRPDLEAIEAYSTKPFRTRARTFFKNLYEKNLEELTKAK